MRNRIINTLAVIVLVVIIANNVTSQETSFGVFKPNTDIELVQVCANCSYINITSITLANKTVIYLSATMTKKGSDFNYTLDKEWVSEIGKYYVRGIGNPDGVPTVWISSFEINPLAISQTISQALGSFAFLFLMIVLMFVFGYVGFRLFKTENWWILGIFFVFFAVLFLIYNVWLGYQYHHVFSGMPDSSVPERIFWILTVSYTHLTLPTIYSV